MRRNGALLEPLRVTAVCDRRVIPVPWARAEGLQSHLCRHGIRSTICLDPASREALLELWPGADAGQVQVALTAWAGWGRG
jgi:hypothetical protein